MTAEKTELNDDIGKMVAAYSAADQNSKNRIDTQVLMDFDWWDRKNYFKSTDRIFNNAELLILDDIYYMVPRFNQVSSGIYHPQATEIVEQLINESAEFIIAQTSQIHPAGHVFGNALRKEYYERTNQSPYESVKVD